MINIAEIKEYLPQRYPFLLVDRVVELEPGRYVVGYKNVSVNEPFFNGHFPDEPIFPGVLILEAMAQVAGVLGFKTIGKKAGQESVYLFAGVDNARFKRPVVPGDQLFLRAEVKAHKRNIWKFDAVASVDNQVVASAEIMVAERELEK